MRARYTEGLAAALILFILIISFCSCCPKLSPQQAVVKISVDTVYLPFEDTLSVEFPELRTSVDADSLINFMLNPLDAGVWPGEEKTISESNSNGVRTRIIYKDHVVYAVTNIDSLKVVIADSIMQINSGFHSEQVIYKDKCPLWPKWIHWPIAALGFFGAAAGGIILLKKKTG